MPRFLNMLLMVAALSGLLCHAVVFAAMPTSDMREPVPFDVANAATVTESTNTLTLGRNVRYLSIGPEYDSPETLRHAPADQWRINHSAILNFGYQDTAYWFVQDISTGRHVVRNWILEQSNSMVDDIAVYLYRENVLIKQWHIGDRLPFHQRPIESARFLIPIALQPESRYQLYFRVINTEAMEVPLSLTTLDAHTTLREQRALIDGLFHGFLVIMAAYSLALYLNLRDKTYLCYVAYVLSMLIFFLSQQGLLYQYVFPESSMAQHFCTPWVSVLIFVSIALFFRQFLELHKKLPRIWLAYKCMLALHAGLCLALIFASYHLIIQMLAAIAGIASALAAAAIIWLSLQGSRSALIVLVGWAFLIAFLLAFVFAKIGVFYSEFLASYGLRIGITFEILIFSFALSFRINEERKQKEWALNNINQERIERIRAQEMALQHEIAARQAKEDALQLEIRHRESLQQVVEERTADLERTLSNLAKANEELQQLSSRDALTGLYNRRYFEAKLTEYWQTLSLRAEPLSLLIIDIDHFKQVNDSRGHLCGDFVLKTFAEMLTSLLHRPCDVITRFGGEEFAVLLPNTPCAGAEHVADLIVKAAADKLYLWENQTLHVTASIGIFTRVPVHQEPQAAWVAKADSALYQAKQSGRNRWIRTA